MSRVDDLYEEHFRASENPSRLNDAKPHEWDKASALSRQVGGCHYQEFKIEPIEFIMANELGFCEGNIVKYICRHASKGGVQDIDKVIHYCELLKELKYENRTA